MSNFTRVAWNPKERVARAAMWMDDYFGKHQYGVMFNGDEKVYRPEEVVIPLDLVLVPKQDFGLVLPKWQPIDDNTPKDHPILVYAPPNQGFPSMISICKWHPDAGFTIDKFRYATIWTNLPCVPKELQQLK